MRGVPKSKLQMNYVSIRYVTNCKLLGADYGFSAYPAYGKYHIKVKETVTESEVEMVPDANGVLQPTVVLKEKTKTRHDTDRGPGDTLVYPILLGWHWDTFHTQLQIGGYVPNGSYSKHKLANVGLNRWAVETDFAFTWLDPKIGTEISCFTGVTVPFTNKKTHYRTGSEWHTEWLIGQYLTETFEVGFTGYWYYQLTPDSGSGAIYGDYRGRLLALGPSVAYSFNLVKIPSYLLCRYYKEVYSKNHLHGGGFFLSLVLNF